MNEIKMELYHDNFQNFKGYNIPKAQLVIADIPYNLANNAYAVTTKTVQGKKPGKRSSTLMADSKFRSICTFAAGS